MRWSKKGKADQHIASDVVKLLESLHGAERLSATTRFQCLEVLFASVPGHERAQVRSTKRSFSLEGKPPTCVRAILSKGRLVAQEVASGCDRDDIFAATSRGKSGVISWRLCVMDVQRAFLNGNIESDLMPCMCDCSVLVPSS